MLQRSYWTLGPVADIIYDQRLYAKRIVVDTAIRLHRLHVVDSTP